MGDVKERRKKQSVSPFYRQWEATFKESVQKKELEKRRQEKIKKTLSEKELNEWNAKLTKLGTFSSKMYFHSLTLSSKEHLLLQQCKTTSEVRE